MNQKEFLSIEDAIANAWANDNRTPCDIRQNKITGKWVVSSFTDMIEFERILFENIDWNEK